MYSVTLAVFTNTHFAKLLYRQSTDAPTCDATLQRVLRGEVCQPQL
jgi:hypothetical protein